MSEIFFKITRGLIQFIVSFYRYFIFYKPHSYPQVLYMSYNVFRFVKLVLSAAIYILYYIRSKVYKYMVYQQVTLLVSGFNL